MRGFVSVLAVRTSVAFGFSVDVKSERENVRLVCVELLHYPFRKTDVDSAGYALRDQGFATLIGVGAAPSSILLIR